MTYTVSSGTLNPSRPIGLQAATHTHTHAYITHRNIGVAVLRSGTDNKPFICDYRPAHNPDPALHSADCVQTRRLKARMICSS